MKQIRFLEKLDEAVSHRVAISKPLRAVDITQEISSPTYGWGGYRVFVGVKLGVNLTVPDTVSDEEKHLIHNRVRTIVKQSIYKEVVDELYEILKDFWEEGQWNRSPAMTRLEDLIKTLNT